MKSSQWVFRTGLIIKLIDSAFEVIGGLLFMTPMKLACWFELLAQHEAYNHPALSGKLDNLVDLVLTRASVGEAAYLLIHGLAKVILISAVFKNLKWGYLGLIGVLSVFTVIEIWQGLRGQRLVLGLALLDAVIVILILREYKESWGVRPA